MIEPTPMIELWLPLLGAPKFVTSAFHCVQFLVLGCVYFGSNCDPVFFRLKKNSSITTMLAEQGEIQRVNSQYYFDLKPKSCY